MQSPFLKKLKEKYGPELTKSVERLAFRKLTRNVHEDMINLKHTS